MKKLIAVILFFSSTVAQAQDTTTFYGVLDVNYSRLDNNATQREEFGQNNQFPSRLGVRGARDLGNALSAFYTLEITVFPQDQRLSGQQNNGLSTRQSFVGLKHSDWGQVSFGNHYTPVMWAIVETDPGKSNTTVGNLVDPVVAGDVVGYPFTVRLGNSMMLQTQAVPGVKLTSFHVLNNTETDAVSNSFGGHGLSVSGKMDRVYLTAAWQQFDTKSTTNVKDQQWFLGAVYEWSAVKFYVNLIMRDLDNSMGQHFERTAQQIGVRGYVSKSVECWASISQGEFKPLTGAKSNDIFGYQVGANYWLAPRTNLYAITGEFDNSNGDHAAQLALGMRHSF